MEHTLPQAGAVLVVAIIALLTGVVSSAEPLGPPVELSCSVFVSGDWDYVKNTTVESTSYRSSCTDMVDRVKARCGGTRVNFVPTHYWKDPGNGRGDPTATYQPTQFCYKFSTVLSVTGECREPTLEEIGYYQSNMTQCFKRAVELGLNIEVTPHLDDGLLQGGWRNALDFDPARKYGSWSYDDVMLTPLLKALGAAAKESTMVWFAMTGEMSLTVVKYPSSYTALAAKFKSPDFGGPKQLQVGVSMNFNKLYTVPLTAELVRSANIPALDFQAMCQEIDFIGISSYSSWPTGFMFLDKNLETATRLFQREVKFLGIDLVNLINVQKKGFHLSEYGIGGGTCGTGKCKATNASQVSNYPYYGIFGPYDRALDPWLLPETTLFRNVFYNRSIEWLSRGGGPFVRVDAAYIWTLASWDFAGIHPDSTTVQGTYYDPAVTAMLKEYNDMVAGTYPSPPPAAPSPPGPEPATAILPGIVTPVTPTTSSSPGMPSGPTSTTTNPTGENPNIANQNQDGSTANKVGATSSSNKDKGLGTSAIIAIAAAACVLFFVLVASSVYVTWKMHQKNRLAAPVDVKNVEDPVSPPRNFSAQNGISTTALHSQAVTVTVPFNSPEPLKSQSATDGIYHL